MSISNHKVFMYIWAGTALIFLLQAISVFNQMYVDLAPYTNAKLDKLTPGFAVDGVDILLVMKGIKESYNGNIIQLQESIRNSARMTFFLSVLSFILALLGFFTQKKNIILRKIKMI